jgi:beta-phosphoglucomutase-like phosphatase (HAD superfamily)
MKIPLNWRWRNAPVEPGEAAIFDLDGVLSDAIGRQHFLRGGRRDWDGFFGAVGGDHPFDDRVRLLHLLGRTLQVVLLTARPTSIRSETIEWLARHDLAWDLLVMRDAGDRRPSADFKRQAVGELRDVGFDPVIGFEDDLRNVEMLRIEGIPCVYIHSGYYGDHPS